MKRAGWKWAGRAALICLLLQLGDRAVVGLDVKPVRGRGTRPIVLKGWGEAVDPDHDCDFELKDGKLLIRLPSRMHLMDAEDKKVNAPRVLREVEGDFIAEVTVVPTHRPAGPSTNPNSMPFNGAGLLFWADEGNYVRLELAAIDRDGEQFVYVLFEERKDRQPLSKGQIKAPAAPLHVRLERRGNTLIGRIGPNSERLSSFPSFEIAYPKKAKIGVCAGTTSHRTFNAEFEGFRLFLPD